MTEAQMEQALARLQRRLGLEAAEEEQLLLLTDELMDAEGEVLLYLSVDLLEDRFLPKVVELAALFYRRDLPELSGWRVQSERWEEGQLSRSLTYLSPRELEAEAAELLRPLARYRRVVC